MPPTTFMFYVYVLKSLKDSNFYIGCTNDLRRRFREHNMGVSKSTRDRVPFELVYYEAYKSLNDARRREARLKGFKNAYKELIKRLEDSLGKT